MNVSQRGLLDMFGSGQSCFVIPLYQRVYSWNAEQCEELLLDALRAARSARDHFLGTIIYVKESEDGDSERLLVIDGQQRITTITLLLSVLRRCLGEEQNGVGDEGALQAIDDCLFQKDDEVRSLRLLPSRPDREAYRRALEEGSAGLEPSPMRDAVAFFEGRLEEDGFDLELLWEGLLRFVVIEVELEDAALGQIVFEGVNSKGVRLSVADMVRNHLLLAESREEQERLYEGYWLPIEEMFAPDPGSLRLDGAIKSWLSIRLKGARIRSAEQVYGSFKRYAEDVYTGAKEPILRELRGFSLMWAENYRYHGTKKYKSASDWAEIGAPALTAGYSLKKADDEAYAQRVREQLRAVDARW